MRGKKSIVPFTPTQCFYWFRHDASILGRQRLKSRGMILSLRSLLNTVGLRRLSVCHLGVLLLRRRRCVSLCLGLCFPLCALELGLLSGHLFLLLLEDCLSFALDLVIVALDDWASNGPDVLLLGNVLCFRSILAVII